MQQPRQRGGLFQLGLGLLIAGVVVQVALALGKVLLGPLAGIAIAAGIVLMIVGLVVPGRR